MSAIYVNIVGKRTLSVESELEVQIHKLHYLEINQLSKEIIFYFTTTESPRTSLQNGA